MKRYLLIIFSLFFTVGGSLAQTTLTTATDFTVTDNKGVEHNLYSYLDDGKHVVLDFFYAVCGPCAEYSIKIDMSYEYFGCNNSDVVFIGIDFSSTQEDLDYFQETYGITYPLVLGDDGGSDICNNYGVNSFPTVILIAPNREIIEQNIIVSDANRLNTTVERNGCIASPCSGENEAYFLDFCFNADNNEALSQDVCGLVKGSPDYQVNFEVARQNAENLIATYTISDNAILYANGVLQESGVTSNDFSEPVYYEMQAFDGTNVRSWVVYATQILGTYHLESTELSLYPNPAEKSIFIETDLNAEVSILDVAGRVVFTTVATETGEINIQNLKPGVYFLQTFGKEGRIKAPFIKK